MASFNKVFLMGNLTRDPELRYTPKGQAVVKIGMAVNRRYTTEAGEQREEVTFVDVEGWGKMAEVIGDNLKKGSPIFIEGRLKLDQWEDKGTGDKRSKLKVSMESFQFIGAKPEDESSGKRERPRPDHDPEPRRGSTMDQVRKARVDAAKDNEAADPDDDDVPF